jgi:OH-DDVA oxygenase
MATITLGMVTAHGPQITLSPADWDLRVEADRAAPEHWCRGWSYSFEELMGLRDHAELGIRVTPHAKRAHFDRCQAALDELWRVYVAAKLDVRSSRWSIGSSSMPSRRTTTRGSARSTRR